MATYGYSAGYQGGGPQVVPSGYIEAYSQAGRNIGQGIQQIGGAIGESLARYGQNKAESEFLTQRLESLAPYLQTVAQSGNIMDSRTPESKLLGDIEKFSSMSIPQKKATLLNAEFFLDRMDKQKAREMQDLQAEVVRNQLAQARRQYEGEQQLGELMRYGLGMPTTQTVTEHTTETLQPVGPVQPAAPAAPAAPVFDQPAYTQALERYRQEAGAPRVDVESIKAQLAQLQPKLSEQPQTITVPRLQGGMGGGFGLPVQTITESPQAVAGRILEAQRQQQSLQAQLQRAQAPAPTMPTREQFTTKPAVAAPAEEAAPEFLPPVEVPSTTTRTEAVPYEQLRKSLATFATQQGMRPELLANLDRVLEVAGQRKPTQVEQVGDVGAVVRFGDKEQFVPAPKTSIDDMLKLKGMTIDFPEFKGTAPSIKEAEAFREQYGNLLTSRRNLSRLLEIASMGKATQQSPEIKTEADQLARTVQGAMRLDILGPGTVTDTDRKLLESIVRNPTDIFTLSSSNKKSLEGLLSRATNGIEAKANSLGLQVTMPQGQKQAQTGLRSDPRIAAIRAKLQSGAITRQQAEQQLRSIQ